VTGDVVGVIPVVIAGVLNVRFIGRNPKILAGTEFDFNVTIVGELVNLVRSLKPDSSLERIRGYIELDAPDAAGISP